LSEIAFYYYFKLSLAEARDIARSLAAKADNAQRIAQFPKPVQGRMDAGQPRPLNPAQRSAQCKSFQVSVII
jgi:hypothetical protein